MHRSFSLAALLAVPALLASPSVAGAQQPLSEFLEAADSAALDVREARAALRQSQSLIDEARARLLPSATATGTYQRNEYEAAFANPATGDRVVIQPFDALTATFSVTVPLIDLGAWSGYFQTEALAGAADARLELADQNVSVAVVQLWYQLVAGHALVRAAERNVETLERNREAAAARVEVGVAPQLELARAETEVARAQQALVEARLQTVLSARNLQNLTGLVPSEERADIGEDPGAIGPLSRYLGGLTELPAVRSARESARAADIASDTAWTALLPSIAGFARESGSNAVGFQGANWSYALGVQATWTLDFARPAQISTRAAAAEIATIQLERAIQQTETGIFEAYERVGAAQARAEAAEAAVISSRRASDDAQARFDAGVGTQLDLIQAERDLFQAEVSLIQTLADLRVAHAALRLRAGMEIAPGLVSSRD
jgi:outer membrane protein